MANATSVRGKRGTETTTPEKKNRQAHREVRLGQQEGRGEQKATQRAPLLLDGDIPGGKSKCAEAVPLRQQHHCQCSRDYQPQNHIREFTARSLRQRDEQYGAT